MTLALFDGVTGVDMNIGYEHHEMHAGSHFFIKTALDDAGGAGAVTEFMFTTPNTATRIHAKASIATNLDYTIEIYEDTTTSADGTPITTINNDRDSVKTSELTAFSGPTVTDAGTLIWKSRTMGTIQKFGVNPSFGYEIIAKTNVKYLFRLTKTGTQPGIIDVDFFWYEHAPHTDPNA